MRIRIYMLSLALCVPAAAYTPLGQAQQTQNGSTTAAQAGDSKQPASPASAQNAAVTDPGKAKPKSKPMVFTNENLHETAAKKDVQSQSSALSAAQNHANVTGSEAAQAANAKKPQSPAAAPNKPKVELDPHKVLTNDDLKKLDRHGASVVGTDVDLSGIYDCDINCYNQVRSNAQVYPSGNLDWMRDLRTGIEKLKLDNDWRAYLVHLADLRSKICTIADEQRTALERADNENNVTDQQIDIREEYTRKLKDVNDDITAEYGRMSSMQANYSQMVSRFMYMQVLRIMTSRCPGSEYGYYSDDPENLNR